jgi:hypothetical protein
MLDRTPRTLVNYERAGILNPIKLNCRSVVYIESEVHAILTGKVNLPTTSKTAAPIIRTAGGTFGARPLPCAARTEAA